jgi:hypothetical protein
VNSISGLLKTCERYLAASGIIDLRAVCSMEVDERDIARQPTASQADHSSVQRRQQEH